MWTSARRIGSALAGAAILAGSLFANPALAAIDGQSTFVAEDKALSFGFTVETVKNDDLWFTIRVPTGTSWGAVGLGSDDMKGALILMIYLNEAGDGVTFSPRTAHGHWEPVHYPDFEYTSLNGTGIYEDHMVFSAHCHTGCRSWPGGYIDVSDNDQRAIYAVGPREDFRSDDPAAPIRHHAKYGGFHIDMRRTFGHADGPLLNDKSKNGGTEPRGSKAGLSDGGSIAHAVFMVLVFVVLLPSGVILLRYGESTKWHGILQGVSLLGGLVGFGLGVATSFRYQRSRGFVSPHQLIGIVVTAGLIGQFVIGVLHHMKYKRTGNTTKFAPVHVWLGRAVILLGTVNGFLGFAFSLNNWRNLILALVVLIMFGTSAFFFLTRLRRNRRAARRVSSPVFGFTSTPDSPGLGGGGGERYADEGGAAVGLREYAPSPAQIGLMDVGGGGGGGKDIGPMQTSRDFV